MYPYSYPSTHAISGLAAVCRLYTPRHPVHLCYPSISIQPPSLLEDILDRACLRCTLRLRSSELRDARGGRDRASVKMHLEAMIVRTCRPWSSESGDTLGGRDRASLEMHLEAVIKRVWRWTWRPWWNELGDTLGGRDRAGLDQNLEAADGWRAGTQFIS